MSVKKDPIGTGAILVRAVSIWALTALLMLCISALLLSRLSVSSACLGYVSSAISFFCAAAAGTACRRRTDAKPALRVVLVSVFLIILLLTVGFLLNGQNLNPSAVLSLVTFTLSGSAAGGLLFTGRQGRTGRRKVRRIAMR